MGQPQPGIIQRLEGRVASLAQDVVTLDEALTKHRSLEWHGTSLEHKPKPKLEAGCKVRASCGSVSEVVAVEGKHTYFLGGAAWTGGGLEVTEAAVPEVGDYVLTAAGVTSIILRQCPPGLDSHKWEAMTPAAAWPTEPERLERHQFTIIAKARHHKEQADERNMDH